jgi:hypothetical protein
LNPSVNVCFFCNKEKNEILLLGATYKEEAPHKAIWDKNPCDECKKYMEMGIIFISVKDPYRIHTCRDCKHSWSAPVLLSKATPNLSGEATPHCPKCSSIGINSSPIKESDPENPYRTGGWIVVKEDYVKRVVTKPLLDHILKTRIAFVPNDTWKILGFPELPKEN